VKKKNASKKAIQDLGMSEVFSGLFFVFQPSTKLISHLSQDKINEGFIAIPHLLFSLF